MPTATTTDSPAKATQSKSKPALNEMLYPISVSYFPTKRKTDDDHEFTAHEFSISVAWKKSNGETEWKSITVRRRDLPKLWCAAQKAYSDSFKQRFPQDDDRGE